MAKRMTRRVPRTQAERREASTRSLVQATIALIIESGVSAVTFDAIGRKGGFSRGLPGLRFGSKQGMIEGVFEYLREQYQAQVAAIQVDDLTALEALIAYVDHALGVAAMNGEERAYYMLLCGAIADSSPMSATFAAEHAKVRRRFEALVAKGHSDGSIRPEANPTAVARTIGSIFLGAFVQRLIEPTIDLDSIRNVTLVALRKGLATDQDARSSEVAPRRRRKVRR